MIYFVKCFTEIYCAQINGIFSFDKALDNLADSVNCMAATFFLFCIRFYTEYIANPCCWGKQ